MTFKKGHIPVNKNKKMKKTDYVDKDVDTSQLPLKPVLQKGTQANAKPVPSQGTQANKVRAFSPEITQQEYDLYDDLEAFSNYVESIDSKNSLTVFVDGVSHLERDNKKLSSNHLVKRNPYYFLWVLKKHMVGLKGKGFDLVSRPFWKLFQDKFKGSVLADQSPGENYIQNGDCVLCFIKYENWKSLQQKLIVRHAFEAKQKDTARKEESKRIAEQVEATGDIDFAIEAYSRDRSETIAQQAQSEHVAGNFREDIGSIMKKLESGESLSDSEMAKAMDLTSSAKSEVEMKF